MAPPQAPADWDTAAQIRAHTLVTAIINNHSPDGNMVLDPTELARLERFATGVGKEDDAGEEGSLAGYLIRRQGTQDPALDERDMEMLRRWFGEGMPWGQAVVR